MENYNPRQNTRMRWKDARELEKFKFITGNYEFDNEVLENASTDPLYKPLIDLMMESNNNNGTTKPYGIIVNDSPAQQSVYVGTINGYSIYMYALMTNAILNVSISYKPDTDTLTTNYTEETFISEDNVKTFFGEQSIIGQGNINLFRHTLGFIKAKAEYADTEYRMLITYYSSKNLKVDSLQDLTALTKASSTNKVILMGIAFYNTETGQGANTIYDGYCGVQFDGSNWRFRRATDTNTPTGEAITSVSDIVTTI